ncbi:MAG: glycine cleavage system aminomethyltransferase GcvT [Planctomycetales bacterium]|nr:glycine cleavage system aminomethyltransferase GcvT [Planctomycetales bacterium]
MVVKVRGQLSALLVVSHSRLRNLVNHLALSASQAKTPLFDWHQGHGARMAEFAGWSMPIQYTSIVDEHTATRTAAGLFDVSHMGRLRFDGEGAGAWLDSLLTRRVADQQPGQVRYSLVTDESGGILDDVLLYRLADAGGGSYYLLVVNAGNREKIVSWIQRHLPDDGSVAFADLTVDWGMIAVQGPRSHDIVAPIVEHRLASLDYYCAVETRIAGHGGIISRTGYTGEDGFELILGAHMTTGVWQSLLDAGADLGVVPAGLGCRDTLRLEAGMPLYGHELSEEINPYEAGLSFAVQLKDRSFLGRDALAEARENVSRRRVGIQLGGRRVAREGAAVTHGGETIGTVTSGTFSPTLERPIAMALVAADTCEPGTPVEVDIRGHATAGEIVPLPFYRRAK